MVISRSVLKDSQARCLEILKPEGLTECSGDVSGLPYSRNETFLTYQFYRGKLSGFYLFFHINAFPEIEPMLEGKYGKAHQNTYHAYEGQFVHSWNTEYGPFR